MNLPIQLRPFESCPDPVPFPIEDGSNPGIVILSWHSYFQTVPERNHKPRSGLF